MNLSPIILALRERCPSFGGRVAGLAEYDSLTERANMTLPAAYVVPLADDPSPPESTANAYRQILQDNFGVIVVLANQDRRGQAAYDQVHMMRAELWAALLGWEPSDEHGPCHYEGGEIVAMTRSFLVWKYEFSAETEISDADTMHGATLAALPQIEAVQITVEIDTESNDQPEAGATISIPQ